MVAETVVRPERSAVTTTSFEYYGLRCYFESSDSLMNELVAVKWSGFNPDRTHVFEQTQLQILFGGDWPDTSHHLRLSATTWTTAEQIIVDHVYLGSLTRVKITLAGDTLESIQLVTQPSMMFRAASAFTKNQLRRQLYQMLLKLYVEQTLLWYLSWRHNLLCLHAAAIEKNGQVVVLAGLNGVGKTSLALSLVAKGYRLFADNYLLMDAHRAFLAPDTVRLEEDQAAALPGHVSEVASFGFGKTYLETSSWSDQRSLPVGLVALLIRGSSWDRQPRSAREIIKTVQHLQRVHGEAVELTALSQLRLAATSLKLPQTEYALVTVGPLSQLPDDLL